MIYYFLFFKLAEGKWITALFATVENACLLLKTDVICICITVMLSVSLLPQCVCKLICKLVKERSFHAKSISSVWKDTNISLFMRV